MRAEPADDRGSRLCRLAAAFGDLVYPRECIACGTRLSLTEHACLCTRCLAALPRIGADQCPRCGDAVGPFAAGRRACPSCSGRAALFFRGAGAVYRYEGPAREVVHKLKYGSDLRAADWMGREMSRKIREADWFADVEALIPVPLHWTRRLTRRFNQSHLLARGVAREFRKPVYAHVLRRIRRTESQALLTEPQRIENVRGVFRVARPKRIGGKVVLLIDDVMTTCATAAECSRALVKAGARRIYVAVFAR